MIRAINPISCTGCGLCEKVCPADLFRMGDGVMTIAYPADCCNCLQCKYVCPVDAITFTPAEPKKMNMNGEWPRIKELMGAVDHPQAAITRLPPWELAKRKAAGGTAQ